MGCFITGVALLAIFIGLMLAAWLDKDDPPETETTAPEFLDAALEPFAEEMHPQEPYRFTACVTDEEIHMAAQTVWGEARGVLSRMEQAAVVWCMLNRVDDGGDNLAKVITAPNQFKGYSPNNPTVDDFGRDLEKLVRDVVERWEREKNGEADVGRVLPAEYLWFGAQDGRNWFRDTFQFTELTSIWDWSLPDPYK